MVFCVSFRGDFQGKYSRRAAPKSPLVLRAGQTMPREIVVFRYRFGVHFCRFPLLSFLPPSLAAFRSPWYARCGQGSSVSLPEVVALHRRGSISHTGRSFDWNNPSMNCLYHRTFLYPVPYIHKVGITPEIRKFPRLRNGCGIMALLRQAGRKEGVLRL